MPERAPQPRLAPVLTAAEVRAAEAPLLAAGEPLMARASAALADVVAAEASRRARVLVLAGRGDNGADALFAAAHVLASRPDVAVDVVLTRARGHERALAAALAAGARVVGLDDLRRGDAYDLVVDGILGIGAGADPALRDGAREAVTALLPAVRDGRTRVVAVDLPSGLQPDDGTHDGVVLPAAVTVTFGAVKPGLTRAPALVGRLVLVDIGLDLRDRPRRAASVAAVVDARRIGSAGERPLPS